MCIPYGIWCQSQGESVKVKVKYQGHKDRSDFETIAQAQTVQPEGNNFSGKSQNNCHLRVLFYPSPTVFSSLS